MPTRYSCGLISFVEEDQVFATPPSIYNTSATTLTIGPVPIPANATVGSLVTRLKNLVDRVCSDPQWIASSELCTTLVNQLVGNPVQLLAFNSTLVANRSDGAGLPDNPYYLLKSNRAYIRSLITASKFGLVYVCGNRFVARSQLDIPVPATYTVGDALESGRLVLPAKPPGAEYSQTEFTTTNQGLVRLRYDGQSMKKLQPTYVGC